MGSSGTCTGIGWGARYSPQAAALLNAAGAHSLEFDDTHEAGLIHPGAPVVAAALAAAEQTGADGRTLLAAVVAGYDVAVRLSLAAGSGALWRRGFSPTPTAGGFGAVAAAAKARGTSASVLGNAFGIHLSQTGGSTQYAENGAWTHALQVGFAAHNGIVAERFAAAGVVGPVRAIEGPAGFLRSYSDVFEPRLILEDWDGTHEIDRTGFKPYPSCRFTHGAIDEIGDVIRERRLHPEEIESIRIGLSTSAISWVGGDAAHKRAPRSIGDAQFSVFFCAAVAALRGTLTWSDYGNLNDPRIGRMIARIEAVVDPRADALEPALATFVEIRALGECHARTSLAARGSPDRTLTWNEVVAKFESLSRPEYATERCRTIVDAVQNLDSPSPLSDLMAHLGA